MNLERSENFKRIEKAIHFIRNNFQSQPNLDEVAKNLDLSPFHFQRIFTEWAGVSPKKFLQYTTLNYAKEKLNEVNSTILDLSFDSGLSGSGRMHDLFVKIEGMTPGEYKNGGSQLEISYSFYDTIFGEILCAATKKGICHLTFKDSQNSALSELKTYFPNAQFMKRTDHIQKNALKIFQKDWSNLQEIKLHLKGTEFQLKVWEALLKIPSGKLLNYGTLAKIIKLPKASRAVGSAIGDNPIAFLIPCHRVIQSTGKFGQYRWGEIRKVAMIGWEASQ